MAGLLIAQALASSPARRGRSRSSSTTWRRVGSARAAKVASRSLTICANIKPRVRGCQEAGASDASETVFGALAGDGTIGSAGWGDTARSARGGGAGSVASDKEIAYAGVALRASDAEVLADVAAAVRSAGLLRDGEPTPGMSVEHTDQSGTRPLTPVGFTAAGGRVVGLALRDC